jgi:hypothetical protein
MLTRKPTSLGMPLIRGACRLGAAELAAFSLSPRQDSSFYSVTPQSLDRRTEPGLHGWHDGPSSLENHQVCSGTYLQSSLILKSDIFQCVSNLSCYQLWHTALHMYEGTL